MTDANLDPAGIAVRPAITGDAAEIARVHVESWQAAYRGLVPQPILDGLSTERRTENWSERLHEPGETRTWVGVRDGRVVGFVGTGRSTDPGLSAETAAVESIYLLPEVRGLGLGRLLLWTATSDLVERGFATATLWVFTANDRARRFYEAAGWQPDGAAQMLDFDGTGIEEVRYRISLAGTPLGPT